ncbi:MAG: serine hydrolase domain-containing protein [Cyclobacteriaceae bacterium]
MKLIFSKIILLAMLVFTHLSGSLAQSSDIPSKAQMDAVFEQFTDPEAPGIAAAVMYKGEVVYTKTFGKANLESGTSISEDTPFQLAEMSAQFTAYAALLLDEAGEISLDDNITEYLEELPAHMNGIKIHHLLSHSHGLYDIRPLRWISGWSPADVFTQEDALRLIVNQEELDYEPGASFAFSDTGMILLAEIIKRKTGMSLNEYTQEAIFQPLGMNNTSYVSNANVLSNDRARAYRSSDNSSELLPHTYRIEGPMNVYSSINDLMIWDRHLRDRDLGGSNLHDKLSMVVTLDDGTPFNQPEGQFTYGQRYIHKERGIPEFYQTGYTAGFATAIWRFAGQDFTVVTLTNTGDTYTGYLGNQIAYLFLEDKFIEPASTDYTKLGGPKLTIEDLKAYTGNYWDDLGGLARTIAIVDDTLRYIRSPENKTALIPSGKHKFQMMYPTDDKVFVNFSGQPGSRVMGYLNGEADPITHNEYEPVDPSTEELSSIVGTYYCKSTDTSWDMTLEDYQLVLSNVKIGSATLRPIMKDVFSGDQWSLRAIKILRSRAGKVTGFEVSYEQIRSLVFDKV